MARKLRFIESGVADGDSAVDGGTPIITADAGGAGGNADEFVSPLAAETTNPSGASPRGSSKRSNAGKRKAKPATGKQRRKSEEKDSANLSTILYSMHLMLAKITSIEEFQLDKDESKQLAEAIDEVNSLYDFSVIPPKAMAWINLCTVAGTVYGPRFMAHSLKPKGEKRKPKQPVTIDGDAYAATSAK